MEAVCRMVTPYELARTESLVAAPRQLQFQHDSSNHVLVSENAAVGEERESPSPRVVNYPPTWGLFIFQLSHAIIPTNHTCELPVRRKARTVNLGFQSSIRNECSRFSLQYCHVENPRSSNEYQRTWSRPSSSEAEIHER